MQARKFKTGQYVQSPTTLLNDKGEVYLELGQVARIMMFDPIGHETRPYGLRKEYNPITGEQAEHITRHFFSEDQLMASPAHPPKIDIWADRPEEYYSHPANPRHEELRHCGWRLTPSE